MPPKVLIGMIHLGPILERGVVLSTVEERAVTDAITLADAGFDALMIENFGDTPFYPDEVPPHTIAGMARVACAIRKALSGRPIQLGINVLRNDARAALAVAAAAEADFIRVNVHIGAAVTDQGVITGRAHETVRYRDRICPGCGIFADIQVKHAAPLAARPFEEEARELYERGRANAIIVSGSGTGQPTSPADVARARAAVPNCPVLIGSGVTPESLPALAEHASGYIVGTWLKFDGDVRAAVDPDRARDFVAAARS
ncbi:MAG: membrane complex biogenesis BtpA family protein [Myxococcota bacterium]|jgi:membrane complex biogenesis BtpA family protein